MTDVDLYQPPAAMEAYQARMVMTPEDARALDEQVRRCTAAVLREGTDYGVIPGTNGEKTLWRPGAQKLLQWFGLGFTCERVEVERDDDGRKHGITYRATVFRRLPDGTQDVKATCEGTADYDESKFYQSAEQVKARLRDQEHKWAAKDRRAPNADRWNSAKEYRADWNALMKRAQKRAIVGAVIDGTAAGGIFSDREEDESPVPQDDGPTWYEQALEEALSFTGKAAGDKLYAGAARAFRDGLCTGRQKDHIQNRVRQRQERLRTARPVDVEDLGQAQDSAPAAQDTGPAAGAAPGDEQHRKLVSNAQAHFKRLGFTDDDRAERLRAAGKLAGVKLDAGSLNDFDHDELAAIADKLAKCRDRRRLEELLAESQEGGGDD